MSFGRSGQHFSYRREAERFWRSFCWILTAASAALLIIFWEPLGSQGAIESLVSFQSERPAVEVFFQSFTFLGDNEFYLLALPVLLWCFDKKLGFWTAAVLLLSGAWTHALKDFFALARPAVEGVDLPASHSFPSGHTLMTIAFWGYLAVMVKSRAFWIWTAVVIAMVGLSRMILGYHFARDIMGGWVFGFLFLAFIFWWGKRPFVEKNSAEPNAALSWLLPLQVVLGAGIPLFLAFTLTGSQVPVIFGLLAGAAPGYALEERFINHEPKAAWSKQLLKIALGLGGLLAIVAGLGGLLPPHPLPLFILRFALGGFWITFLAPAVFVKLGLSPRAFRGDLAAAEK